jgi:hypothetical protein
MESNQLVTMTFLKSIGLGLKTTAPADSNKLVTKGDVEQYYYVDGNFGNWSSYASNRLVPLSEILSVSFNRPPANYYQYDVTRSGIPGANGGFFTYIGTDNNTYTVLQDSYGYVGRFCMKDGSYMNNQYNLYTFSLVGVCAPSYGGYPVPIRNVSENNRVSFSGLGYYTVHDVAIYGNKFDPEEASPTFWPVLVILNFVLFSQAYQLLEVNALTWKGTGQYFNNTSPTFSEMGYNPVLYTDFQQFSAGYTVKDPDGNVVYRYGYGAGANEGPVRFS